MVRDCRPLWDRFWAKVDTTGGPDACWPWIGALSHKRSGTKRGLIQEAGRGSRLLLVHRVALCFTGNGLEDYDRPEEAAHTCDNRLCCNPVHLYWATAEENRLDRYPHLRLPPLPSDAELAARFLARLPRAVDGLIHLSP